MNNIEFYYSNYNVQNRIVKYLYNRETCLITSKISGINNYAIRNLRIHNTQSFRFYMNFLRMFASRERTYNLYYSMAEFRNGVPYRDTKNGNLVEDFEEWNEKAKSEIVEYDMLIDIDAGDFSELDYAAETADNLKALFDYRKVPYHLRFSGKGFHFVIPHRFFPPLDLNPDHENTAYELMRRLHKYIYNVVSEMVDYQINDSRRVAKIPYSLSIYDEGAFVCSPVHDLKNFDAKKYLLENFKYVFHLSEDMLNNPEGNINWLLKNG